MTLVPPTNSYSWYEVWFRVFFLPSETAYQKMINDEKAVLLRGVIWVLIGASMSTFVPSVLYFVSGGRIIHDDLLDAGDYRILMAPLGIIGTIFSYYLATNIFSWLAIKLGGKGSTEKFGYLFGAILPLGMVFESLLEGLISNPYLSLGARLILLLYEGFLISLAIKTVHNLPWTHAILSVFSPSVFVSFLVFACSIFGSV